MAIAFVQSKSTTGNGNTPVSFTSNNTAGNFIIVAVAAVASSAGFTMSDSQSNSYFTVTPFVSGGSSNGQIYFASNIKVGPNTVTFFPGAAAPTVIAVHEFSGLTTIDQLASAIGNGNAQDSTGATTTKANELLFGFTMGDVSSINSISSGVGFTPAESSVTASPGFITQWQIVSATGTYNSTSTTAPGKSGTFAWGAEIETFFNSTAFTGFSFVTEF